MAHPLFALRQTDVVHMLPALELVGQLKQRPFCSKMAPHTFFPPPGVVMCSCHPHKRSVVRLSTNNNGGTSTSVLKCLLLGIYVNA